MPSGAKAIGQRIESWLREIRFAPRVLRRFGTLRPGQVTLPGTGAPIHFDPADRRARKKLLFDTVRGRIGRNVMFWRDAVAHLAPEMALDVGANYGECVFSTVYPAGTRVVAIEANPRLLPYLQQSTAAHPDRERIEVLNIIAADETAENADFFINPEQSGESTALPAIADTASGSVQVTVAATTVDALFAARGYRPRRLVFKLDVEGFETRVFQGMTRVLATTEIAVGYVEVDSHYLSQSGWDVDRYDREILSGFELFVPVDRQSMRLEQISSLRSISDRSGTRRLHTDLVVVKRPAGHDWSPPQWGLST